MNTSCNCKRGCGTTIFLKTLLIIGGLNWGLVGVGGFIGRDLNLVHMIFGSMPAVEWIVYVVVGLAALLSIFRCKCKTCGACATCGMKEASAAPAAPKAEGMGM